MRTGVSRAKWPKSYPPLTAEQQWISDDFVKHWHEVLPRRFAAVDRFNHEYVVRHAPPAFRRTLEIGAGLGEHLEYENLTHSQEENYYAIDIRDNMAAEITRRFPRIRSIVGDCQARLDFVDNFFDRIIAIHVLEHLPDLPSSVRELHRLCDKNIGTLAIVIPCEGGLAYGLARRISAQRVFEKRYGQSYQWFIQREHLNAPDEIFEELEPYFERRSAAYFPIPLPAQFCNLCVGAVFAPRSP